MHQDVRLGSPHRPIGMPGQQGADMPGPAAGTGDVIQAVMQAADRVLVPIRSHNALLGIIRQPAITADTLGSHRSTSLARPVLPVLSIAPDAPLLLPGLLYRRAE